MYNKGSSHLDGWELKVMLSFDLGSSLIRAYITTSLRDSNLPSDEQQGQALILLNLLSSSAYILWLILTFIFHLSLFINKLASLDKEKLQIMKMKIYNV